LKGTVVFIDLFPGNSIFLIKKSEAKEKKLMILLGLNKRKYELFMLKCSREGYYCQKEKDYIKAAKIY